MKSDKSKQATPQAETDFEDRLSSVEPHLEVEGVDEDLQALKHELEAACAYPQNYTEMGGTVEKLAQVHLGRPPKDRYIMVHPDGAYRRDFNLVTLSGGDSGVSGGIGGTFLIFPHMVPKLHEVDGNVAVHTLYTCMTAEGAMYLWPIRFVNDLTARGSSWHVSARNAAAQAQKGWVRVISDRVCSQYRTYQPADPTAMKSPAWPKESYWDILALAFPSERMVKTPNHPLIAHLAGRRLSKG